MSVSRPARCIFSASALPIRQRPQCRAFHISPNLPDRRRPRFRSVKASEMGLISPEEAATRRPADYLKPYTAAEKEQLAKLYTPEQLKAIEAGEEAVDVEDIDVQGFLRTDPYRLKYLDDLSKIRPVIDKRPQVPHTIPDDAEPMTEEQSFDELSQWMEDVYQESLANKPLGVDEFGESLDGSSNILGEGEEGEDVESWRPAPQGVDFLKHLEESTGMTGGGSAGSYSTAPGLPKNPDLVTKEDIEEDPEDNDQRLELMSRLTGIPKPELGFYIMRVLVQHRVVNQTRLGKIQSIYCLAICGNRNGRLGIGEAKATEAEDARSKAVFNAVRNMVPIMRYENRTIHGDVDAKVSGTVVQLRSRPPGFGLRCQNNIFEMARAAGISDLAARVPRSRNKMNVCKAVWHALQNQRIPEEIARGRGKKLVDVRKVYYGGNQSYKRLNVEERKGPVIEPNF